MFYFFIFIFHNYLFKYTISLTTFYKNDYYFLSLKPKKNKESEKKIKRKNQKKKALFFPFRLEQGNEHSFCYFNNFFVFFLFRMIYFFVFL